jgi:hypothetical protein
MQILQPLTVGNVCASPGNVLHVVGVHQINLKPTVFQKLHEGNPVNTGGFHGHGPNLALLQPVRKRPQVRGESEKHSHRLRVSIRRHSDINLGSADVDTGSIRIQNGDDGVLPLGYTFA